MNKIAIIEDDIDICNMIAKLFKILYLIFDYPHKHYTFKHFEIQESTHFTTNLPRLNEP